MTWFLLKTIVFCLWPGQNSTEFKLPGHCTWCILAWSVLLSDWLLWCRIPNLSAVEDVPRRVRTYKVRLTASPSWFQDISAAFFYDVQLVVSAMVRCHVPLILTWPGAGFVHELPRATGALTLFHLSFTRDRLEKPFSFASQMLRLQVWFGGAVEWHEEVSTRNWIEIQTQKMKEAQLSLKGWNQIEGLEDRQTGSEDGRNEQMKVVINENQMRGMKEEDRPKKDSCICLCS